MEFFPTKQPDQSGPRCRRRLERAIHRALSLAGFSRPCTARIPHIANFHKGWKGNVQIEEILEDMTRTIRIRIDRDHDKIKLCNDGKSWGEPWMKRTN